MNIKLDLKTDLPKLRAAFDAGQLQCQQAAFKPGSFCNYSGPCAVGAMLSPDERVDLDVRHSNDSVRSLTFDGVVDAPEEQHGDLARLQRLHDKGMVRHLGDFLSNLEDKYA